MVKDPSLLMVAASPGHIFSAKSLLTWALVIAGLFGGLTIGAGVVAIIWNAVSPTNFDVFGFKLTTGHVGVALIGIGAATLIAIVRRIMQTIERLGALPD